MSDEYQGIPIVVDPNADGLSLGYTVQTNAQALPPDPLTLEKIRALVDDVRKHRDADQRAAEDVVLFMQAVGLHDLSAPAQVAFATALLGAGSILVGDEKAAEFIRGIAPAATVRVSASLDPTALIILPPTGLSLFKLPIMRIEP